MYTSSSSAMGESRHTVGREDSPHQARTVHLQALQAPGRTTRLRARRVARRPGGVGEPLLRPGTRASDRLGAPAARGRERRLPVLVDTTISLVDIEDCAKGHVLAETRGTPGERYLLSGASLTTPEAVDLLDRIWGSPARCGSRRAGSRRWAARSPGWARGPSVATRPCAPRPFGRCSTATGTTARGPRGSSACATHRSKRRCDARSNGARNGASFRPRASGGRARRMAREPSERRTRKTARPGGSRDGGPSGPQHRTGARPGHRGRGARRGQMGGRGDKVAADQAAVDAMRLMIDSVSMDGVVVIGEGGKDEADALQRRVGRDRRGRRATSPSTRSTGRA